MSFFIVAAIVAVFFGSSSLLAAESGGTKVKLLNADRQEVGEVTVRETPSGVLIRLDLQNTPAKIAPGSHAIHIHETGDCTPPFKSAGAHWNPGRTKHGFLDKSGAHGGDLPNIHVPENGPLTVEMLLPRVSMSGSDSSLLDADGFAVVIHQRADDYRSDPAGDSGDRIACAAVAGSKQSKQ